MPLIVVKTIPRVDNLENTLTEDNRYLGHSTPGCLGQKNLSDGSSSASSRQGRSVLQWATVFFACRVASRNLLIARCPKTDMPARATRLGCQSETPWPASAPAGAGIFIEVGNVTTFELLNARHPETLCLYARAVESVLGWAIRLGCQRKTAFPRSATMGPQPFCLRFWWQFLTTQVGSS